MEDEFKIYVDQLRDGDVEHISEAFSPAFLDISEKEVQFLQPVEVSGEAYLADDQLVLHLDIRTEVIVPCAICNEPVSLPLEIRNFYHMASSEEIKTGIYVYKEILREAILLETPSFAECEGKCPKRQEIQKYLKKEGASDGKLPPEEGHKPFAHL